MTEPVLSRPQRDVLNALQAQPDVWHAPDKRNRYAYQPLMRLGLVERSPDGLYRAVKVKEGGHG
ncbi:hypothetical protein JK207_07715 [Gluconobacter cerinus]|uniref:hypothetical protein n=1 Tax=Gluconobacter cerinus TaxID=38307 RepID=UPI001B8B0399|nr:hypothetical protein [Gluconobacter cerinus]MBS1021918.1 hypothetical protein [Gluconobacter cerinus]